MRDGCRHISARSQSLDWERKCLRPLYRDQRFPKAKPQRGVPKAIISDSDGVDFGLSAPTARPIPAWGGSFAKPQESESNAIRTESPPHLSGTGRAFSPKPFWLKDLGLCCPRLVWGRAVGAQEIAGTQLVIFPSCTRLGTHLVDLKAKCVLPSFRRGRLGTSTFILLCQSSCSS